MIGPRVCGDLHTGNDYVKTKQRFCRFRNDFPSNNHVLWQNLFRLLRCIINCSCNVHHWIFNQHCRYLTEFWRYLEFVPNLNYHKGKFWKRSAQDKLQDKHNCLKVILKGISEVHLMGGIWTTVLGRDVVMKPWIHFLIGDAQGNNEVCGHFNHHGKCTRLYCDCRWSFDEMGKETTYCKYVTLEELKNAFQDTDKHGRVKAISK